jgi:DNA-binding response OmpR family regulator
MKKILIIEDDGKIAAALAIRLKSAGYEPIIAPDGFEGLRRAVADRPDLILMDIWMPVGIGFSVAQRLPSLGLKDIPLIFITASRLPGLRRAAEQLGAVAFFEKPYDPEQLLAAIAHALQRNGPLQETSAAPEPPKAPLPSSNREKILVVEDDSRIAAALAIRMECAGYEVLKAPDGRQGLLSAAANKPDLIITDIWMPDPIGFLNKERLENLGLSDVPVIYITASKKADLREIALQEGAAAFFEKPYEPEDLLLAVARALRQRCEVFGAA